MVRQPVKVEYRADVPLETFDFIFTDECHRSIYDLWRQVLEYFDAYLIGLTATPSKQTLGFFNQNLVMEYGYEQAVADGVNVDHDIYRIRTQVTQGGGTIEAGWQVDFRDRATRAVRWQALDEDLTYPPTALDRSVVAVDQIRTVVRTFKEKLPEIFPGRIDPPKTLIYAKDDSHADDIVRIVREEFARGNDFAQKITYKTTGRKPEELLNDFRNLFNPRIVVTVDMIATGTDIQPLEIVMFMRPVRSRIYFEQMKGRGGRIIDPDAFQAVTRDAKSKTHFVLVDCVGVVDDQLVDAPPLERKPTVPLAMLLQQISLGSRVPEVVSSVASRLARLDRQLGKEDRAALAKAAGGLALSDIGAKLVEALDPDRQAERARAEAGLPADVEPSPEQVAQARDAMVGAATAPLASNPALRNLIVEIQHRYEQVIDTITKDEVIEAGFSVEARDRARGVVESFEAFLTENRDEITALQVLYGRPYRQRLRFADIKGLAQAIGAPPRGWTPESLWRAYEALERSRVRGSGPRVLTDIVALVRYALKQEDELVPFADQVRERFEGWLATQEIAGRRFSGEQRGWLELIRDHVAASFAIEMDDFELSPFAQRGGAGRAYQVFGEELDSLIEELNGALVA